MQRSAGNLATNPYRADLRVDSRYPTNDVLDNSINQTKPSRINTANLATIFFVVFSLLVAGVALIFGVIAYIKYQNMYTQKQTVIDTIRVQAIPSSAMTVLPPDEATNAITLLFAFDGQKTVIDINLKNSASVSYVANYPYSISNQTVAMTLPYTYAQSSGIIVQSLSGFVVNQNWSALVIYRALSNKSIVIPS